MANTCNCRSMLMGFVLLPLLPLLPSMPLSNVAVAEQSKLQLPELVAPGVGEQAVSVVADEQSLQALALRIESMSGIHVVIAPGLSQTLVTVSVVSPNWLAALLELFADYSTVVAWGERGQIHSFYVLTSATPDSSLKTAAVEPAADPVVRSEMPAELKDFVVIPASESLLAPQYTASMGTASVMEFMTRSPGNLSRAEEQIPASIVEPGIRNLLQRMRAVEVQNKAAAAQAVLAPNSE